MAVDTTLGRNILTAYSELLTHLPKTTQLTPARLFLNRKKEILVLNDSFIDKTISLCNRNPLLINSS